MTDPEAAFPPLAPTVGPNRLPRLDPAGYDDEQRAAAAALEASPRGEVRGPFVPLMRSPELMDRAQRLGEFIRYRCSVPERLRELAILVAARIWNQPYEWHAHARLARQAGVSRATVASLLDGAPATDAEDERVVIAFCRALHLDRRVDDATYAAAVALLGERGAVELTGLCGYYALLAMVLNVARTPVPGEPFALPD